MSNKVIWILLAIGLVVFAGLEAFVLHSTTKVEPKTEVISEVYYSEGETGLLGNTADTYLVRMESGVECKFTRREVGSLSLDKGETLEYDLISSITGDECKIK